MPECCSAPLRVPQAAGGCKGRGCVRELDRSRVQGKPLVATNPSVRGGVESPKGLAL